VINRLFFTIKNSVWLLPALFSISAIILAMFVSWADQTIEMDNSFISEFLSIDNSLAKTIISTIAGSLLTMTTITFSTIMVVLTTYSSQFSPRTLQNFIKDSVTMRVLGIFIGGFVFSIFVLLLMSKDSKSYILASSISVLVASICVGLFAYFIHHVASSVRVSKLIEKLSTDVLETISKKEKNIEKNDHIKLSSTLVPYTLYSPGFKVVNKGFGYIQLLNAKGLYEFACEKECVIDVHHPIGSFLSEGTCWCTIYSQQEEDHIPQVEEAITVGNERTTMQDIQFGLLKLSEVALRAISPGINDPNTAIDCIKHLGLCLKAASRMDNPYLVYHDEKGNIRLRLPQRSFDELIRSSFYQICHYGREDISIVIALYDALLDISGGNKESIIHKCLEFSEYIEEKIDLQSFPIIDQQLVYKHKKRLQENLIK